MPRPDFEALSGNLVIYGAGFQGLLTAYLLDQQGIQVLCFGDQDVKKQGTTYYGLPVYSPEEMKRKYPEAVPIVTPYSLSPAYKYVIKNLEYKKAVTPFSLFLEFDSAGFDMLDELPFWYHAESLNYTIDMFMRKCVNMLTDYQLLATDISLTEVCNLRCRNCTSLMPNYKKPRHYEFEDICHDIYTILQGRRFQYIFLEGGEIFLWASLPQLVQKLSTLSEIMNIVLVTNGTVIPNSQLLSVLQHPKVCVRISDYGKISKKDDLISIFKEKHIRYWLQLQKWYELSTFHKNPLEGEALKKVLTDCCKANDSGSTHISDGKLFRCPLQAHMHGLGIFVSEEKDYVDLRGDDKELIQKRISKFMDVKSTPPMVKLCQHCDGRGYSGKQVPPAEQLAPGEKIQVRFE